MSPDAGFEIVDRRVVAETSYIDMEEVTLRAPDGALHPRTVVRTDGAVALIPIDGEDVVLIRQYRIALDRAVLELPAGKLDVVGEDPEECAKRELIEEVGLAAGHLEEIFRYYTSPGFTDEEVIIYVATDVTPAEMNRIGPEEQAAEVVRVPLTDIPELLPSIEDSKTVIGLQALLLRGM